jgi:glycosyltransferase involved in cell wall biosynthesis
MQVSIVVPIYNERENIPQLYDAIKQVLTRLDRSYEILFVDDGSLDGSADELDMIAAWDPTVKVIHFRRNFGQTAAMSAGLEYATGEAIVTLDGDMQNDPTDIPMMLAKLEEGFDLVHGWRKHRQDAFINRKLPSKIANWLIAKVTNFPVHDLGCTLKVMRREIAQDLRLYGEMHRFIPILAHWQGAKCVEVETKHHPRRFGTTKYGIWRTVRVVLDLLTVKFMIQYSTSPMKLFGGMGLLATLGSMASCAATVAMKVAVGIDMTGNPLLLLSGLLGIAGLQFFVLGLLGEVCARIYFESQCQRPYRVRGLVNFDEPSAAKSPEITIPGLDMDLRRSMQGVTFSRLAANRQSA